MGTDVFFHDDFHVLLVSTSELADGRCERGDKYRDNDLIKRAASVASGDFDKKSPNGLLSTPNNVRPSLLPLPAFCLVSIGRPFSPYHTNGEASFGLALFPPGHPPNAGCHLLDWAGQRAGCFVPKTPPAVPSGCCLRPITCLGKNY